MRKVHLYVGLMILLFGISCSEKKEEPQNTTITPVVEDTVFYRAMDLSFEPEIEAAQVKFYDENGNEIQMLPYVKSKGVNMIRLRLWHTPADGHSGLPEVLDYAKRIGDQDMKLLLDIHYSDTWADPAQQSLPAAWQGLAFTALKDSVYSYTKNVLQKLDAQGTLPAIVQIGNETNAGFLWDFGRVGGTFNNNWPAYATLVNSAIHAIKEVTDSSSVQIMLHLSGFNSIEWFFDNAISSGIDFDIIGISYYSIWHGNDMNVVKNELVKIASTYSKKILIAETGYPWTLGWNDWTNNTYGLEDQLIPDYPATPDGQKAYLLKLSQIVKNLAGNQGIGFCYWAPDWVAFKGNQAANGSSWENVAIFDFDNKILPVIDAFKPE